MKTRRRVACLALTLGMIGASAQLHLITGSAGPKSPNGYVSALFHVTSAGSVKKVEDLVTEPIGTDWITASQNLRSAVLAPRSLDQDLVVVDFDKASAVKRCKEPEAGMAVIDHWIWDTPDHGPVYAEYLAYGNRGQLRAMLLDPSVPCNESFLPIGPQDAKYLVASGSAGVAESGGYDYMRALIRKDGSLSCFFPWGVGETYFDERMPVALFADFAHPIPFVMASNAHLFVVGIIDDGLPARGHRLLVFRKGDKTWLRMPDVGESTSYERAFGTYIAAVAVARKEATKEVSAGRSEWRTGDSKTGPSMLARFHDSPFVFPGRLYLFDASTERTHTIITNQGDSEILLVENGAVYYRASDRLYRADLTDKGLSPGRLLATSEVIRDAHWAFIKH